MRNIAIVTGSASGIGREIVRQMDKKDLDEVWIIDKNKTGLDLLQQELQITTRVIDLDLTDPSAIQHFSQLLIKNAPCVQLLANCAGYGKFAQIGDVPLEQELGMIRLNCEALTSITVTTLPFIQDGGKIINIASSAAHFPIPHFGIYSATKSYVLYFSRILNTELKHRHITVTALCPGPVDTGFFEVAESHGKFNIMQALPKTTPEAEARKALNCSKKGKPVATLGFFSKAARVCGAILPHAVLMFAFDKLKSLEKGRSENKDLSL